MSRFKGSTHSPSLSRCSSQHCSHQLSWRSWLIRQHKSCISVVNPILNRLLLILSLVPDERIRVGVPFREENATCVHIRRGSSIDVTLKRQENQPNDLEPVTMLLTATFSGLRYSVVPPPPLIFLPCGEKLLNPKSAMIGSSVADIRMFPGFKSSCVIPRQCMAWRATRKDRKSGMKVEADKGQASCVATLGIMGRNRYLCDVSSIP